MVCQWYQLNHMQIICTTLQTNNQAHITQHFYRPDALPDAQPTVLKHWRHTKILRKVPYCKCKCVYISTYNSYIILTYPLSFRQTFSRWICASSALTLLVGWQEGHSACKKTQWWDAGMVICLGRDADLHMPSWCHCHSLSLAPVNTDWFYIPGFTFLVPAHPGSPGHSPRAVKW